MLPLLFWSNLYYDHRMGMKFSSGSKEAHNWRSLWMHIAIDSLWISTQLPSCLMVAACDASKLLTRYNILFLSLTHTITHTNGHVQIGICSMHNEISYFSCFSLKWRMVMRLMLCCTKLVAQMLLLCSHLCESKF